MLIKNQKKPGDMSSKKIKKNQLKYSWPMIKFQLQNKKFEV